MDTWEFARQLALDAIAGGALALEDIARACGGACPLDLRDLLDDLASVGALQQVGDGYALAVAPPGAPSPPIRTPAAAVVSGLPLPHPLDCDWRFDPPTVALLVEAVGAATQPGGHVLLLGTPTVFEVMAAHRSVPGATLVDRNRAIVRALDQETGTQFRAHLRDLLAGPDPALAHGADVALCDPPWYPEHYRAFLARASLATRIGGRILVSLMPVLARPRALDDRE